MDYEEDYDNNKYEINKFDSNKLDLINNDAESDDIDYEKLRNDFLDNLYDIFIDLHNDIKYNAPHTFLKYDRYRDFINFIDN